MRHWRMTLRDLLFLPDLARFGDVALLFLRVLTGAFLVYGVWDNITSAAHMDTFVQFLAANGFHLPSVMAPVSVWAQFVCGVCFVLGLFTRWAGLVMAFNFVVAIVMVHWAQDLRGWWPAAVLVPVSLVFATIGAGRISLDHLAMSRHSPAARIG